MGLEKYTDQQYYAERENNTDSIPADFDGLGYYQYITLPEIVNNYMMSETGENMLVPDSMPRHKVEFAAQRAIQEFSYDVFRPVKGLEFQADARLNIALPQDFVDVVQVSWIDNSGFKHPLRQRFHSGNPNSPMVDTDGNFVYDTNGKQIVPQDSDTLDMFNSRNRTDAEENFYNYYAGSFENDELYDRYYSYYGRRFGSEPSETNINGTYLYDEQEGTVFIDENFAMAEIIIDYVSDGLADDPAQIRVHKFAEQAIYSYIRKMIVTRKQNTPLYEKQLATKMHAADKRRAKHRLSTVSGIDIYQAILNKQKWIKR